MALFGPKIVVNIEVSGARFEGRGHPDAVQRSLETFLNGVSTSKPQAAIAPKAKREEAPSDTVTTQVVRRRVRRGRQFIRLHAIEGEIAKIYPIDERRLGRSWLHRVADLRTISNIYVENSRLSQNVRGDQNTMWHAIMPSPC